MTVNAKPNYQIPYLNNSWKTKTELKTDIIWKKHQNGNKSQKEFFFSLFVRIYACILHVARPIVNIYCKQLRDMCNSYRNVCLSCTWYWLAKSLISYQISGKKVSISMATTKYDSLIEIYSISKHFYNTITLN